MFMGRKLTATGILRFYDSVLDDSIRRLNPKATPAAIDEALLKLRHFENAEPNSSFEK